MKISKIKLKIKRLEKSISLAKKELVKNSLLSKKSKNSSSIKRSYSFDIKKTSIKKLVDQSSKFLEKNGFCVIENLIPYKHIKSIKEEIINAQKKSRKNICMIRELLETRKFSEKDLLKNSEIKLRSVSRLGRPSKPPNDIIWMPKFSKYLANSIIVKLAKTILDDHLRISQIHSKIIPMSNKKNLKISLGNDMLGLPRIYSGPETARDWHSDWPHDPSAYGGDNPDENIGSIRQPFPDITMGLVMIWFLTDVDEKSGGTWVVPGSHKDKRTPRGPDDKINITASIPGEMQVQAKAGSVLIQDTRLWHSSPLHNFSKLDRVAVVTRWYPWWLAIDDYAPNSRYNVVCRPISLNEFKKLPKKLRPMMRHLCPFEKETIQKTILKRSKKAVLRTKWGYNQLKKKYKKNFLLNKKIKIKID